MVHIYLYGPKGVLHTYFIPTSRLKYSPYSCVHAPFGKGIQELPGPSYYVHGNYLNKIHLAKSSPCILVDAVTEEIEATHCPAIFLV